MKKKHWKPQRILNGGQEELFFTYTLVYYWSTGFFPARRQIKDVLPGAPCFASEEEVVDYFHRMSEEEKFAFAEASVIADWQEDCSLN